MWYADGQPIKDCKNDSKGMKKEWLNEQAGSGFSTKRSNGKAQKKDWRIKVYASKTVKVLAMEMNKDDEEQSTTRDAKFWSQGGGTCHGMAIPNLET
jgi:hypothetical protein